VKDQRDTLLRLDAQRSQRVPRAIHGAADVGVRLCAPGEADRGTIAVSGVEMLIDERDGEVKAIRER
jgi:hypothetical protein